MKHLIALLLVFSFQTKADWKQKQIEMERLNQETINALNRAKNSLVEAEAATNMEEKLEFAIEARQFTNTAIENTKIATPKAHSASKTANAALKHARIKMQQLLKMKAEATDRESKTAAEEALKENGIILRENRDLLQEIHEIRTKVTEIQEEIQVILVQIQSIFLQAQAAGWTKKIHEIIRLNQQARIAINRATDNIEKAEATNDTEKKAMFAIKARKSARTAIRNTERAMQEAEKPNIEEVDTQHSSSQIQQSSEIESNAALEEQSIIALRENNVLVPNVLVPKVNRSFSNTIHDIRNKVRETGRQAQAVLKRTNSICSKVFASHEKTATPH